MPRIAGRRNWAPGPSAQVDWSNPLTTGLRGYGNFFEEWTHIPRREYPTNFLIAANRLVKSSSKWGRAIEISNIGNTIVGYRVLGTLSTQTTMMTWVMPASSSTTGDAIALSDNSNSGFRIGVGDPASNFSAPGNTFVGVDETAGGWGRSTGTNIGTGFHSLAVASTRGVSGDWYIDGSVVATIARGTEATISPWYIEVAGTNLDFFTEWIGISGPWAAWERVLTAGEISRLNADPFQMLRS